MVQNFAIENSLALDPAKCEVMVVTLASILTVKMASEEPCYKFKPSRKVTWITTKNIESDVYMSV